MHLPYLTHRNFLILAALIDGSAKSYSQVKAEIEWSSGTCYFNQTCRKLHHAGLIDKTRGRRMGKQPIMLISITQAGRQTWIEQVDFYLYFAKRFGSRSPDIPKKKLPPGNTAERQFRPPSPSEEEVLLASANREFCLMYRSLRLLNTGVGELFRADVTDVDFNNGTLRLESKDIVLDESTRPLLIQAVGQRTSGPLFFSPTKKRWSKISAGRTFDRLKHKLGFPKELVLTGNHKDMEVIVLVPSERTLRVSRRCPTPDEEMQLCESATPEFVRFYRAFRLFNTEHVGTICAIDICDIDFENDIIHLGTNIIVLDETTMPLVTEAVNDRTSGPLFLTPGKKRWTEKKAGKTFWRLRGRSDLPKEITLTGGRNEKRQHAARKRHDSY